MSLKNQLQQIIKERKQINLDDLAVLCKKLQYKTATAERRLREARATIKPVYNQKKTAIIGYKYEENNTQGTDTETGQGHESVREREGQKMLHLQLQPRFD